MEAPNAALLVYLRSFSFPLFSRLPVELNSVSDSSRRHSPTKRIASVNAGRGGVTWACVRVERGGGTEGERDGSR